MGSQPFLQTGKSLLFLLCPCIQNPHITHTGQKHFIHVRDVCHPFPAHRENIIAHTLQDEIRTKAVSPFRSGDKIAVHVRFFMCRAVNEGAIGKNHVHVVGIILFCSFYDPVDDFFVPVHRHAAGWMDFYFHSVSPVPPQDGIKFILILFYRYRPDEASDFSHRPH